MFSDVENPCEYQYGLTGTFSLMLGFAIGLPPLWNIETGESGNLHGIARTEFDYRTASNTWNFALAST